VRRIVPWAAAAAAASLLLSAACAKPFVSLTEKLGLVSADSIAVDLYLIGDAGLPAEHEPVLAALRDAVKRKPGETMVVFLGDNVYPHGLPDSAAADRRPAERALDAQVDAVVETGARGIMVPGNHDWNEQGPGGLAGVQREGRYVDARGKGRFVYLPRNGCPGPEVVDLGNALRLVLLDTQWWLHPYEKTGPSSGCRPATEASVIDSLKGALRSSGGRPVIVAGHHPMASGGIHGGYFEWYSYLTLVPLARQAGFAAQDLSSRRYKHLIAQMNSAFQAHPPLLYAAGHEHNLQVIRRGSPARWLAVSGGGIYGHTELSRVIAGTQYAARQSGYMRVTALNDGRVRLAVEVVGADGKSREEYTAWLVREPRPGTPQSPAPAQAPAPAAR
jgi:hypothetical protein